LETLLKDSDIVTIHIPLLKETHHLIEKKHISMMKNGAVLINTSRGAIVDEMALANALKAKRLSFAGIDVFEHEPPGKNLLLKLDNAILTPHVAGLTSESFRQMCVQPIKTFLEAIR
jgi:phosphoglycerate dehydrogenase-like enzyme